MVSAINDRALFDFCNIRISFGPEPLMGKIGTVRFVLGTAVKQCAVSCKQINRVPQYQQSAKIGTQ